MKFSFVGDLGFNTKADAKVPAVREIGDSGLGINASIAAAKNNRAYIEATGWEDDAIKTKDVEGNNIEVAWKDRNDEDVVKKVAFFKKNIIVNGDDREEFIAGYDFCEYIKDHIDELADKRCLITGTTQENFYKGKESKRFQISNIYVIDKDDERKNNLDINTVLYFTKDSIDAADFKNEKKIYINGYTQEYLSGRDLGTDKGGNRYIPLQVVLDCSKIDIKNENHFDRLLYFLANLGLEYDDGKIVNNLKSNKYYANDINLRYYNGAKDMGDAEEITYDMLTKMQQLKVDCGLAEPKDFAAKGKVYGDRIVEYKVHSFSNVDKYANGYITLEDTVAEFEDQIFVPSDDEPPFDMPEPIDDEEEKPKKKSSKAKKVSEPEPDPEPDDDGEDDLDDLFG